MLFDRMRQSIHWRDKAGILVDILVVIIGILIAFQIDRWGEDWRDAQLGREYLLRNKEGLQMEPGRMDAALDNANSRIRAVCLLDKAARDPATAPAAADPLTRAVETATWR